MSDSLRSVSDIPADFAADLRRLEPRPELEDSLWRSPALARLTYGQVHRLVAEFIGPAPARILDVGCGTGFLSLELARAGHLVDGIDPDGDAIQLARRTSALEDLGRRLTYHQAGAAEWHPEPASYDTVVIARTLHHIPDPAGVLGRVAQWLEPGGRLVCLEFAHDLFDRRSASWVAQCQALLGSAGLMSAESPLPSDPEAAVARILDEWHRYHVMEEDLNELSTMLDPLRKNYSEEHFSWHPYLYWDVLEGLQAPSAEMEEALGQVLAAWEEHWIGQGEISALLFLFVGRRRRQSQPSS